MQGLDDISAAENGRLLKDEIGDRATLIELAGIGHAIPVEDTNGVADVLIAAFGRNSPARGINHDRE